MNRENLTEEIFDFSDYSRFANTMDGDVLTYDCDSVSHTGDDSSIREGNLAVGILKRKQPPDYYQCDHPIWVVEYVTCYDCDGVMGLFERVEKDTPVAVVEGHVLPGNDCLILSPLFIWDIHIPNEAPCTSK